MAPPKLLKIDRAKLKELNEKCQQEESKGVPLQEVLEELKPGINALIQKGFTYEEIAAYLEKNGVPISVSAVKEFVQSDKNKKPAARPKNPRQPRKPKAEKDSSSDQKRPAEDHSVVVTDVQESKELDPTAGLGAASSQTEEDRSERSDRYSSPQSSFNLKDPEEL